MKLVQPERAHHCVARWPELIYLLNYVVHFIVWYILCKIRANEGMYLFMSLSIKISEFLCMFAK